MNVIFSKKFRFFLLRTIAFSSNFFRILFNKRDVFPSSCITFSNTVRFNKFTVEAPVLIAVVTEKSNLTSQMGNFLKNQQYNLIDIGIAIENFVLQAAYEDLGTCIMGWFDESKIKKLLNVPSKKRVNIVISLGYPSNDTTRKKTRKSLDEIARYNTY